MILDGTNISTQRREDFKVIEGDVVRAKQIELIGPARQLRMFATVVDDEAQLIMCDCHSERRLEIKAGKSGGAEISFIGDHHTSRLGIALSKNGIATIALLNAEGRERFKIEVDEAGMVVKS